MRKLLGTALVSLIVLVVAGCAARGPAPVRVMVPPQIDLAPHQTIGILQFSSSSKGELGPLATRRFTEAARRDQGLVRIVDLGPVDAALRSVGKSRLDPEAVVALAHKHGLKTLVAGDLNVSSVRPNVRVDALFKSGSLSAQVDASLTVQMFEAETGASVWNRSSNATTTVAHVSVYGMKEFAFDSSDPDAAYGGLVDSLVSQVTRPFQVTWARR